MDEATFFFKMQKDELYKRVKIWGVVSFIPIVLAAGPFAGYVAGDYLRRKCGLDFLLYISIGIGFIVSITEVIRIVRLLIKITK